MEFLQCTETEFSSSLSSILPPPFCSILQRQVLLVKVFINKAHGFFLIFPGISKNCHANQLFVIYFYSAKMLYFTQNMYIYFDIFHKNIRIGIQCAKGTEQ